MANKAQTVKVVSDNGPMGWVLFTAYVGAAIYFVQQSVGFFGFILALLKAAVWPAYVVNHVLEILKI